MIETKRAITKLMEDYAATISYENGKLCVNMMSDRLTTECWDVLNAIKTSKMIVDGPKRGMTSILIRV